MTTLPQQRAYFEERKNQLQTEPYDDNLENDSNMINPLSPITINPLSPIFLNKIDHHHHQAPSKISVNVTKSSPSSDPKESVVPRRRRVNQLAALQPPKESPPPIRSKSPVITQQNDAKRKVIQSYLARKSPSKEQSPLKERTSSQPQPPSVITKTVNERSGIHMSPSTKVLVSPMRKTVLPPSSIPFQKSVTSPMAAIAKSPAPVQRASPGSAIRKSPSPVEKASPMSLTRQSPAPAEKESPMSFIRKSPAPLEKASPMSLIRQSPAPAEKASPMSHLRQRVAPVEKASPMSVIRQSPAPLEKATPMSLNRQSPAPVVKSSPMSLFRKTQAPVEKASPASLIRKSPAPIEKTAPMNHTPNNEKREVEKASPMKASPMKMVAPHEPTIPIDNPINIVAMGAGRRRAIQIKMEMKNRNLLAQQQKELIRSPPPTPTTEAGVAVVANPTMEELKKWDTTSKNRVIALARRSPLKPSALEKSNPVVAAAAAVLAFKEVEQEPAESPPVVEKVSAAAAVVASKEVEQELVKSPPVVEKVKDIKDTMEMAKEQTESPQVVKKVKEIKDRMTVAEQELFDLLNLDPHDENSKAAFKLNERAVVVLARFHGYAFRRTYKIKGYDTCPEGKVFPLTVICALGASMNTIMLVYALKPDGRSLSLVAGRVPSRSRLVST